MTPDLIVANRDGTRFAVTVSEPGDCQFSNDPTERTVTFYDFDYADNPAFTLGCGQKVSSYHRSTLLGLPGSYGHRIGEQAGVNLDGGIPKWTLDQRAAAMVADYLDHID
jgi:hypothetical protein